MKNLIALITVPLVLLGAVLPLVLPRHCRVNRAAFERIEKGMTQAEVEEILGGPPGDYRTRPGVTGHRMSGLVPDRWLGDEGTICVLFLGVARQTTFHETKAEPVGPLEVILWRLQRLLP